MGELTGYTAGTPVFTYPGLCGSWSSTLDVTGDGGDMISDRAAWAVYCGSCHHLRDAVPFEHDNDIFEECRQDGQLSWLVRLLVTRQADLSLHIGDCVVMKSAGDVTSYAGDTVAGCPRLGYGSTCFSSSHTLGTYTFRVFAGSVH